MQKKMNKRATRKAFTLVELVIVIAVIGILASVLIPTFASVINSAKDNASIQQATNARDEYITTYLISPEEAIGLLIETPRDWFIVNKSCEVEKINIEDYDLNQYEKLPDIPTIKDVHIYRKKNTDIYTITFLVRDGNIVGNKKVYTMYNLDKMYSDYELTQESTIPTAEGNKIGYNSVFLGWQYGNAEVGVLVINADGTFTNENIKSIFKDGKFNVESDINLYAKFERTPIEYTIHYELDDGTNNEDNPLTYTIEDEIVLKDATKQNYTFKGWYTDIEFNGSPITKIAKGTINDITLYAKFVEGEEATYKVEYYQENIEDEEYTLIETISDLVGATGETVTADIKTYEGFTFDNDNENNVLSEKVIFDGSLVLKVYYNRNIYTITWNIDGDTSNTEPYKYGAMPTYKGETPTKEQDNLKTYTFKTWSPTIEEVKGEQTYTARFEETARKYDVIIYVNNVEKLRRVYSCDTEFDLTTLYSELEQENYEFLGLTTKENIGTTNYVTKIAERTWGEKKFYANYKAVTYMITYNLNDGMLENGKTNPITYTIETETFTLNNPSKKGYTFTGWTGYNGDIPQEEVSVTKGTTGNLTFTANYNIVTYSINYELDSGMLENGKTNPITYTIETETFTLNNPSKTGYTFTGWTGSNGDTPQEEVSITKGTTGNLTFTANYDIDTYTIKYELDNGVLENGKTNPITYTIETESFTLNNPSKKGYTFTGWTGFNGDIPQEEVSITKGTTGNLTFTANYNIVTYSINYELDSGMLENGKTNPITYTVETESFTLNNPSKTGYTFTGWTGSNGDTPQEEVSITKGTTGNLTFTANYDIDTYTIKYELDNGVLENGKTNPTTYTIETESFTLNNPSKTGYTFTGWTGSNGNIPQEEVSITKGTTGNLTFTANYNAETYSIHYELDGSTNNNANPNIYNVETEITLLDPTKTTTVDDTEYNYAFDGWFLDRTFTKKITKITKGNTGDLTLYAKFVDFDVIENNGELTICIYLGSNNNVTIPSTINGKNVIAIGDYAFEYSSNITSITIPNTITSIGSSALANTKINSINIPNSVLTIKDYAFESCTNLKTVIMSNNIYNIESYTFVGCTSLTDVTLPNNLISIGERAFNGCSALKSINLPQSLKTIGSYAFAQCDNLSNIEILDNVTTISDGAFSECISLKNITIPDSVTSIGKFAFSSCTNLANITLPSEITSIEESTFDECALVSITIPNKVTIIGQNAFYDCSSLTNITLSENLITIGASAFNSCTSLAEIVIPDSVTTIEGSAFIYCSSLKEIVIPNSVTSIGSFVFSACPALEKITLPFVGDKRHTQTDTYQYPFGYIFGQMGYSGCTSVEQYYYGSSTTSTTRANFYFPSTLKEVIITDCTYLPYGSFYNCKNLTNITLPNNLSTIGDYAFYNNTITSINIPDNVIDIGNYAFMHCSPITSITISSSSKLKNINDGAFAYCDHLKSIIIPSTVTTIGANAFANCPSLTSVTFKNANNWKAGNTSLTYANLSNTSTAATYLKSTYTSSIWTKIDYNYTETNGQLKITSYTGSDANVVIPATIDNKPVVAIGDSAFYNKLFIESITIPSSITLIDSRAFYKCSKLQSIKIDSNNTIYDSRNDCNAIIETSTNKLIYGCKNTIIPDGIKSIESYSFAGVDFETINIPNSVTSIGTYAFEYSTIKEIVIPNTVMNIGTFAFSCCSSLEKMTIPFVGDKRHTQTDTYQYPFGYIFGLAGYNGCTGASQSYYGSSTTSTTSSQYFLPATLKEIVVTDCEYIPYGAFQNCIKIESITLPSNLSIINANAFDNCTSLTSVTFKNTDNWKAGSTSISASDLSNTSTAATYLKSTYTASIWTRN